MDIIAAYGTAFVILAIIFGLYMTWGIGANDLANAMGTSVGAGAVTLRQAICIAIIFEFSGAVIAGGHVTSTIRKGIIDPSSIVNSPEILVYGMLASLLAAAFWLMIASWKGWPVSTTHSIIGALIGFAIVGIGPDAHRGQVAADRFCGQREHGRLLLHRDAFCRIRPFGDQGEGQEACLHLRDG